MTNDLIERFNYDLSAKAIEGLQAMAQDLCDTATNRRGSISISPLVQAIGSGMFSIAPRDSEAIDPVELQTLVDLARVRLIAIERGPGADPYHIKQCRVNLDRNASWGLKSIAHRYNCKTSGGNRRRISVSVLLNEIGLGIHLVLPIPDIQIRYLYLQSAPLICEYLAVKSLIDADRQASRDSC